jgi:hypothetical protein
MDRLRASRWKLKAGQTRQIGPIFPLHCFFRTKYIFTRSVIDLTATEQNELSWQVQRAPSNNVRPLSVSGLRENLYAVHEVGEERTHLIMAVVRVSFHRRVLDRCVQVADKAFDADWLLHDIDQRSAR